MFAVSPGQYRMHQAGEPITTRPLIGVRSPANQETKHAAPAWGHIFELGGGGPQEGLRICACLVGTAFIPRR